ncbi:MAG: Hsp20/alpha crystallin family protein [Acetobacteraceae bacterium]|nr:Hsp20/alpha crystallin family protein [Acetobacteraceae bacterium]
MANIETKVPAKLEQGQPARSVLPEIWRPFERLRREMDRLVEDFDAGSWRSSPRSLFDIDAFWRREAAAPAVDIVERPKGYEVTAELPGMTEKDIELKVANDTLTIRGEKKEEKEEKQAGYYLSERRFGAFSRSFQLPAGVDESKIEASFKKGVLTVTLPKKPEAIHAERTIPVNAA